MNVLVIAPHPDDEAIGCGGAICLHQDAGDRVTAVFLTSGELGLKHLSRDEAWRVREGEAEAAAEVLGIAALTFLRLPDWDVGDAVDEAAMALRPVLQRDPPDMVYLPHPGEWHPDHRAALPIVRAALHSSTTAPPTLRTFEVWTPLSEYDQVEDITPVMRRKLQAVRCYRSQIGHFRYDRAVSGLNQYRGSLAARCRYAEVFGSAPASPDDRWECDDEATRDDEDLPLNGGTAAGRTGACLHFMRRG
jgi:N-acetylglucosamine malate deacetylase 1